MEFRKRSKYVFFQRCKGAGFFLLQYALSILINCVCFMLPKRILLKISGEMLKGEDPLGISGEVLARLALSIKELIQHNIQVAIVIGAGNLFRGIQGEKLGISQVTADYMGMLATMINGLALQEALRSTGIESEIMSALPCEAIAPVVSTVKANELISKGIPVIFTGGTGNPFFTTDTAAALRAAEIKADLVVKATKVSGVYSKDPNKYPDAIRYERLSYAEALEQKLLVMDHTAFALCMSVNIPIFVFKLWEKPTIIEALQDMTSGTIIS